MFLDNLFTISGPFINCHTGSDHVRMLCARCTRRLRVGRRPHIAIGNNNVSDKTRFNETRNAFSSLALGRAAADTVSYTSYSSIKLSPEAYRSGKMPIGLNPQPSQIKKSSRIAESNKKQVGFEKHFCTHLFGVFRLFKCSSQSSCST
jgi:hypothetical protein